MFSNENGLSELAGDVGAFKLKKFKKACIDALASKSLNLKNYGINDRDISELVLPFLNAHPDISELDLMYNDITDEALFCLAQVKSLKKLNVAHTAISSKGVLELSKNSALSSLNIMSNKFSDNTVTALIENDNIETLYVTKLFLQLQDHIAIDDAASIREKNYKEKKESFFQGAHPHLGKNSAILHFYNDVLCDKVSLTKEIFGFIQPKPIKITEGYFAKQ